MIKKCILCGNEFNTKNAKQIVCNANHILKCTNCNKDITVTSSDWYKKNMYLTKHIIFCDNKCSIQYNKLQKFYEKYNPHINEIKALYENTTTPIKDIISQFNLSMSTFKLIEDRYNLHRSNELKHKMYSSKNTSQLSLIDTTEWKHKLSSATKLYWNNISKEDKNKITEKRLNTWNNKSDYEKKIITDKVKLSKQLKSDKDKMLYKQRISNSITNVWKRRTDMEKNEIHNKVEATTRLNDTINNYSLDGIRFDSSYERDVYEFCKRNYIPIQCQVPLKYIYNNKEHTTYIDFKIDDIYFECKGAHLLSGLYSDKLEVPIEAKLNLYKQNHVILITDKLGSPIIPHKNSALSNGLKYLNKCSNPLIGVDIDLFRSPKFPYAPDKPPCFYKVKVDNELSALEAWSNESIRWKMIKNRINYVGGFIDNKEILNAMNITRTCKQPSWFSKSYAKNLINKYIHSDIILDPFAGWGTRCDAAKELNLHYYGWDLNKELVEWHNKQGRLFSNNCGIEYGDANNIKTDRSECSIFICPPYTDFEKYFDGQDLKTTQIEWLKIVMQNIPNAKEYLMVCKIIDKPEYNKYIVETKINKSHLGTNNEYVIYVNQSDRLEFLSI